VSDVLYLYGFVPASAPAPPDTLRGIAGAPVRLLDLGPLLAVTSLLPAAAFDATRLEERLSDLAWVGEQGLAHERVVLYFVDQAQILPSRLFSLYSGEAALRRALGTQLAAIAEQLRTLGDRREWNLKVAFDAAGLARHGGQVSADVRTLDEEIATAPPGRRYLLERRRSEVLRHEVGRAAKRLAGELLDALAAYADAARTLPLSSADEAGTVVLNAALLVSRAREAPLQEEAERRVAALRALGMLPAFTGPWAPYRFLEESADG
jgi:hypothetical protein